jgi:hypothetical protein
MERSCVDALFRVTENRFCLLHQPDTGLELLQRVFERQLTALELFDQLLEPRDDFAVLALFLVLRHARCPLLLLLHGLHAQFAVLKLQVELLARADIRRAAQHVLVIAARERVTT